MLRFLVLGGGGGTLGSALGTLYSSSQTTTISDTAGILEKVSMEYVAMGRPRSSTYCLGIEAPNRLPTPPDRSTTLTLPSGTAAARMVGRKLRRIVGLIGGLIANPGKARGALEVKFGAIFFFFN